MRRLFQQRRRQFLEKIVRYQRYVWNDHFVLAMLVAIGFVSLQYRNLLLSFPSSPWGIIVFLVVYTTILLLTGRAATYLLYADSLFLITRESEVVEWIHSAYIRAMVFWSSVQLIGQVVVLPIYLKLGVSLPGFFFLVFLLTMGKIALLKREMRILESNGVFNWLVAIGKEEARQQSILRFFSLFTTVKGMTNYVKRRRYLDNCLRHYDEQRRTWDFLYWRAFVRSGDFLELALRLLLLSLAVLVFVEVSWLAVGLVLLLNYMLLFQLLGLYRVYTYQYLIYLYPISSVLRKRSFLRVIRQIMYGIAILQTIIAIIFLTSKLYLFVLLLGIGLLYQGYLPMKVKQVIDERAEN